ncbi:MAG: N-acetyltransferase family protein [Planctomycetota bacterium]
MSVHLRPGRMADAAALGTIYNHFVASSPVTFDLEPRLGAAQEAWTAQFKEDTPHQLWVACEGEAIVAYASSSVFRAKPAYHTSIETSVYVAPGALGRGLGAVMYGQLFDSLAALDLHRAYAAITLPNEASLRLHRNFGFTDCGVWSEVGRKFGRFWDVALLEKRLSPKP